MALPGIGSYSWISGSASSWHRHRISRNGLPRLHWSFPNTNHLVHVIPQIDDYVLDADGDFDWSRGAHQAVQCGYAE